MDIITVFGTVVPGSSPGGSTMKELAQKFSTPLYVYEASVIEKRAQELKRHLVGAQIHYAIKANGNPHILKIIKKAGFGVEAVSPGELRLARLAGFPKSRISFTCSNIAEDDLAYAAMHAGIVHLDSLHQLEMWGRGGLGRQVSLRVNQGIGAGHHEHVITSGPESKFGIDYKDLASAQALAAQYNLRITGIQQHIGSHVLDADLFARSMQELLKTARQFPDLVHVDFGGGLGVPYKPSDTRLNLQALGKAYKKLTKDFVRETGRPVSFAFEPGRYLVAEAGTLLVSVVDVKKMQKHVFVGVNSGMNHLIRHAMYGSYHHIANQVVRKGPKVPVIIAGNICESGDLFAKNREMTLPHIGDILEIQTAGAYGMSMASLYNMRELPREVLLQAGKAKDISFKREEFLAARAG